MLSQRLSVILCSLRRAALMILLASVLAALSAHAQTFSVIHTFTNGTDGGGPLAGLSIDDAGILYGTTFVGGGIIGRNCDPRHLGCGLVFEMKHHTNGWILTPLYPFFGWTDGLNPYAPVTLGPGGVLYGSTYLGGNVGVPACNYEGCGLVFALHPQATACHSALCDWIQVPLYAFQSIADGDLPRGPLSLDAAGNVYGSTNRGGAHGCGTVFQLTRSGSNWTKTLVHDFDCATDGGFLTSGVFVAPTGVLYGVTAGYGPGNNGTVYSLTPSGSGWTFQVIHSFGNPADGAGPLGGLIMDPAGNLYGTTAASGSAGGGTVFELSPSGGGWTFTLLASLSGIGYEGSAGRLAFDSFGNIYGTTLGDGAFGYGNVFKLTRSGTGWTYTDLYDFTCGDDGGSIPDGPTLDSAGNIYGTAQACGSLQHGTVWEITP